MDERASLELSPTASTMNLDAATRKRSSRACDGCKHRRMKCEDIQSSPTGKSSCRLCRENKQECTFQAPVRKRGPPPGFRRRAPRSSSPYQQQESNSIDEPEAKRPNTIVIETRDSTGSPRSDERSTSRARPRPPLLGLPTALVDQLLAVYFTHVHNVWPLIYKPLFNPHTTSAPLLLAMLAIASCVAPAGGPDGLDAEKLFHMAESSLHHCRMESRIDIIQSLILLSLRQTGCGDKRSAFSYAGRACCMALNLGLNLNPTAQTESPIDSELRSRVYWNCYVLDKTLAEETGRSFILPYRRSSTPLPSMTEADELETWPPLPISSAPLPRSVRHIIPRRGYVMSCFVWSCRLAMVVEDILDLEVQGPPAEISPWDQQFGTYMREKRDPLAMADAIAGQLDAWRAALPRHLDVDLSPNVSPLPHHVVGLAWYHTAQILLHSRFIKRRPTIFSPGGADSGDLAVRAHSTCSRAAEAAIDLFAHLDRHKLLGQVSADIIHLLSLATLFEAFDATDSDETLAHRAKVNFAQCCIWLRDFSSSWPAASIHKLFFEGLIQGGLKLSSPEGIADVRAAAVSPETSTVSLVGSPPMPDGLRAIGRNLSSSSPPRNTMPPPPVPGPGVSSLFQLPQFYWNHLTNATPGPAPVAGFDSSFDFVLGSPDILSSSTHNLPEWSQQMSPNDSRTMNVGSTLPSMENGQQQASSTGLPWEPPIDQTSSPFMGSGPVDQAAIYSALMSYMVEAAKSR